MFPTSNHHSIVPLMSLGIPHPNQFPANWQNPMNHQDNRYHFENQQQQHFSSAPSMNDSDTDFRMWTPQNQVQQHQQQQNFNNWMEPNVPGYYSSVQPSSGGYPQNMRCTGQQGSRTTRSNLEAHPSLHDEEEQAMPFLAVNQNGQIVETNQVENFQDSPLNSPSKTVSENMDQTTTTGTADPPTEEYEKIPPLGHPFNIYVRFEDQEYVLIENLTHEKLILLSQQAVHLVRLHEQDIRNLKKENKRLVEELEAKAQKSAQKNVSTASASTEVHLTDVCTPDEIIKYMERCGCIFSKSLFTEDRGVQTEIRKTITKREPEREQVQILEKTASQLWFESQEVKRKFSICSCDYCYSDENNEYRVAEKKRLVNEEKTGETVTGSVEQQHENEVSSDLRDSAEEVAELPKNEYCDNAQDEVVNPVVDKELSANGKRTGESTQTVTERGTKQNESEISSDLRDSAEKVVKLAEYPENFYMYAFDGHECVEKAIQVETPVPNEATTKTSSFSDVVSVDRERLSETASNEEMDQEVDEKANEEKESHILNNPDYVFDKEETTEVFSLVENVAGEQILSETACDEEIDQEVDEETSEEGENQILNNPDYVSVREETTEVMSLVEDVTDEQIVDVLDSNAEEELPKENNVMENSGKNAASQQRKKKNKNKNKNKNKKKQEPPQINKEDDEILDVAIQENEDFLLMKSTIIQYFAFAGFVSFTHFGFVKERASLHPFYDKILQFWLDDLVHVFDPAEDKVEGVSVHLDQRIKHYSSQKTAEAKKLGEFYSHIRLMLKESLFTRHMVMKDMSFVLGKDDVEKDEYAQLYYEMVRDFYIWQPQVFDLRAANIDDLSFSDLEENEKLFFVETINAETKAMTRTIFDKKVFEKAKNKEVKLKIAYNIAISKLEKPKDWNAELTKQLLQTRRDCWAQMKIDAKEKSKYISFYNTLLNVDSYILHTDIFMLNTMTALLATDGRSQWILETAFMEAWFGYKCQPILFADSDMELSRVSQFDKD
ncbi:hypothetical protein B9Z55_025092 [Caenorhabditis nigoni]|uniref:Uncharacterized protein n=1 Tax=Caenorhabditis nigoni TaxID=1611254 RepID=A0A2G5SXM5_9PELO|nr:hypothetical protein B9Z55_025092 [Caenorhabditis nigoni]